MITMYILSQATKYHKLVTDTLKCHFPNELQKLSVFPQKCISHRIGKGNVLWMFSYGIFHVVNLLQHFNFSMFWVPSYTVTKEVLFSILLSFDYLWVHVSIKQPKNLLVLS